MAALWLEVDEEGRFLRRSPELTDLLAGVEPPVLDLGRVVATRSDVSTAIRRRAGVVRFGVGHGPTRRLFDATVSEGGLGARLVLEEARSPLDAAELGALVLAHVEANPDAFVVCDPDGVILWCDVGFEELLGYARASVLGRFFSTFRSPRTSGDAVDAHDRALHASGHWAGEMAVRRADGVDVPAHHQVTLLRDPGGRVIHEVIVVRGVAREHEIERLRSIDQSVALLSRVMSTFANRLNNLAFEVSGEAERAMLSDDPASAGEALARVQSLAGGLGELGRTMLALAASGTSHGPADLGQVARDLGDLLHVASGGRSVVEVRAPESGPWVACTPDALIRASVHLALRALDGGGPDAPVVVSTDVEDGFGVLRIGYRPTVAEREALRWLLPDGRSAGPEVNALITRAYGQGVTLSLDEDDDGAVAVEVRAALGGDAPTKGERMTVADERRWGRLLVAEDNPSLREMMVMALDGLFAETIQVGDAEDALAAAERLGGELDLVIVDVHLPGASGLDLLVALLDRWPGLRAVVASGAAGEGIVRSARAAGASAVLRKPFKLDELRAVVRSVLAGAEW